MQAAKRRNTEVAERIRQDRIRHIAGGFGDAASHYTADPEVNKLFKALAAAVETDGDNAIEKLQKIAAPYDPDSYA